VKTIANSGCACGGLIRTVNVLGAIICWFLVLPSAFAFEGRILATISQGNERHGLLYTAGTNFLRVENTATNWPNPVDILNRNTGELILLFPQNRSFLRLRADLAGAVAPISPGMGAQTEPTASPSSRIGPANLPGMPAPPPMPPGVGPQSAPGAPPMPAMPMMPPPMMEKVELRDTGEKTNLLGFVCEHYEIKDSTGTEDIWATAQLFPFQPYAQNQPHHFGPRMVEDEWGELVKARKLFPLLVILKFGNGSEHFRFEVQSVTPRKLTEEDMKLFEPPPGYFEIQPLPF
jgi:hypothetical protein